MMRVLALLLGLLAGPLSAQQTEVDVELLLLVDVSRSMSPSELALQRQGYATALTSPQVVTAIGDSMTGQIALAYVEWAGAGRQRIIMDWTLIRGEDDLTAFADVLRVGRLTTQLRTSIHAAIDFGADYIDGNGYAGLRRVIDISGDGPNNEGRPAPEARDQAIARGITINGLPLMTRGTGSAGMRLDDLDVYYANCVIGGPGAFVIPVTRWEDFAEAVTRKLVLELADAAPAPEQITLAQGYNCLIGEQMWFRRNQNMREP
ncbi:hypothetical protein LOM8899_01980 [Flavimaricola marinus]|uniref:VWFA domain-containing protein n=2 Tax=Flavimaricola marinus TaxID=1819565 RepID=A0A238LG27_9RHOB|nr:hypothetical protein LOM8899_01980 [Flavimaricola marinus]